MPKCASALTAIAGESAARCAEVVVAFGGVRRTVYMGGVALADFPEVHGVPTDALAPGQSFAVRWSAAVFHGRDSVLGPLTATLRQANSELVASTGIVRSLASVAESGNDGNPSFFPAINRNSFFWRLVSPRLGLVFDSSEALENEATIHQIPPVGSVYQLVRPVTFTSVRSRAGILGRTLSTVMTSPKIVLESCRVKLMELAGLEVSVDLENEFTHSAQFRLRITNRTAETNVTVTWMVWPPPEEGLESAMGVLRLGTQPKAISITLPRDIFYRQRWVAVSLSEPFDTNAAQATEFPPLS